MPATASPMDISVAQSEFFEHIKTHKITAHVTCDDGTKVRVAQLVNKCATAALSGLPQITCSVCKTYHGPLQALQEQALWPGRMKCCIGPRLLDW